MTSINGQKLTHTEYMRLWRGGKFIRQRSYTRRPELSGFKPDSKEYKKAWRNLVR